MGPDVKTMVRMPRELRDWFYGYAKENNRSMNAQLINMLKRTMRSERGRHSNRVGA